MLKINHYGGFFSCSSLILENIVKYFNENQRLPDNIDTVNVFEWYKTSDQKDHGVDIRSDYFTEDLTIDIQYNNTPIDYEGSYQFLDYSKLNYTSIIPFIRRYFNPSQQIQNKITILENKYNLCYENICVIFFRGNDKFTEMTLPSYDDLYNNAKYIQINNPNIQFLIQSDETEFIQYMTERFPNNSFYFKDEIRHMNRCATTVDVVFSNLNSEFSKYYLAITFIMSKCKYIICNSGNCSIWTLLFRGNNDGVFQHYRGQRIYNENNSKLFEPRP